MHAIRFTRARKFRRRVVPWLEREEAAHNKLIGLAEGLARHPNRYLHEPHLLLVEDEEIRLVAAATPPGRLIVSQGSPEAAACLGEKIVAEDLPVPGVTGPTPISDRVAETVAELRGCEVQKGMRQILHVCDAVTTADHAPGRLRLARRREQELCVEWCRRFRRDAGLEGGAPCEDVIRLMLSDRRLFVWDHQGPVSCAAFAAATRRGARIAFVFTPEDRRGHGYATACTAALTERLLRGGRLFTVLYTDTDAPIPNHIYRKIGYRPLLESRNWDLA